MDKYTPTTEEARGIYEVARALHSEATGGLASPGEVMAEFDRWLNAERARIWEQCAQAGWESKLYGHRNRDELMARNPYEEDA